MILTTENVLKKIEVGGYKFAKLYMYSGRECSSVATLEATDDHSLAQLLADELIMYPPNGKFKIELKSASKSGNDNAHTLVFSADGTDPFSVRGAQPVQQPVQPAAAQPALSGLGVLEHPAIMALEQKRERLDDMRIELIQKATELKIQENNLEQQKKAFREELRRTNEEIEALRKKFESNTEVAKAGFDRAFGGIMTMLTTGQSFSQMAGRLMGVPSQDPEPETQGPVSPEAEQCEKIATMLFESNVPAETLKSYGQLLYVLVDTGMPAARVVSLAQQVRASQKPAQPAHNTEEGGEHE